MRLETKLVNDQRFGLIGGTLVAVLALSGAVFIAKDSPWVAASLVSLPVLGFIKVLVSGFKQGGQPEDARVNRKR